MLSVRWRCVYVHACLCEVLAVSVVGGKGSVLKSKVYCLSCHHYILSPLVFKRLLGSIFKRCFPLKTCLRTIPETVIQQ